jgi:hypothetical protein
MEENNLLLKHLLLFNCGGNVPGPLSWSSWKRAVVVSFAGR